MSFNFSLGYTFQHLIIPFTSEMNSASFWLNRGNELCNSGDFEEAIKAYDHALTIDNTLVDAWNNKGMVLANMGRHDDAIESFDEALKLSPKHVYTLSNRGMVLGQQKKYDEALKCFDAAIGADAYFAGAWYNKALALQALGRGREAKAAMKTAMSLEPAYRGNPGCRMR